MWQYGKALPKALTPPKLTLCSVMGGISMFEIRNLLSPGIIKWHQFITSMTMTSSHHSEQSVPTSYQTMLTVLFINFCAVLFHCCASTLGACLCCCCCNCPWKLKQSFVEILPGCRPITHRLCQGRCGIFNVHQQL